VRLFNTNAYEPRVTVVGAHYLGATDGTLTVDGLDKRQRGPVWESFNVVITGVGWPVGGGRRRAPTARLFRGPGPGDAELGRRHVLG
jgi:hypothetical protein